MGFTKYSPNFTVSQSHFFSSCKCASHSLNISLSCLIVSIFFKAKNSQRTDLFLFLYKFKWCLDALEPECIKFAFKTLWSVNLALVEVKMSWGHQGLVFSIHHIYWNLEKTYDRLLFTVCHCSVVCSDFEESKENEINIHIVKLSLGTITCTHVLITLCNIYTCNVKLCPSSAKFPVSH